MRLPRPEPGAATREAKHRSCREAPRRRAWRQEGRTPQLVVVQVQALQEGQRRQQRRAQHVVQADRRAAQAVAGQVQAGHLRRSVLQVWLPVLRQV